MKKTIPTGLLFAMILGLAFALAFLLSARVQAQEIVFPNGNACAFSIDANLKMGDENPSVWQLQKILNITPDTRIASEGAGSPGNESMYFGSRTLSAVVRFQEKYAPVALHPVGLQKGTGYVGEFTRKKLAEICQVLASGMTEDDLTATAWNGFDKAFYGKLKSFKGSSSAVRSSGGGGNRPPSASSSPSGSGSSSSSSGSSGSSSSGGSAPTTGGGSSLPPPTPVNGQCSATLNACAAGSFSDAADTSSHNKWSCNGSNGGTSASCSIAIQTSPQPESSSDIEWGALAGYSASELSSFEQLVGKPVDIRMVFTNWDDSFPSFAANSSFKSAGKTLLVFWEQYGVSLDTIINGDSDAYIRQFASAARAYGGKVIISPLHEMNGDWDPWGGTVGSNTPAKVVAAWKKIRDAFGDVPNVRFAWAVNNVSVPDTAANAISKYYPGDEYTDYVAVDGFNFGDPWQTFDQVFKDALEEVKGYGKPVYILSTASAQGAQKAAWITDFGAKTREYGIKGWVWFNENKEEDWRVNSDSASLAAFKAILP